MNKRNLQISAAKKNAGNQKIGDFLWRPSSSFSDVASSSCSTITNVPHQIFGRPPIFSARIPSPVRYFPPRPNIFPPRPDMFPPRPDMFPPRRDMTPPGPDMFPRRPDMFSPRPRPDMFHTRPNMIPPRTPVLQSRHFNSHGTNNPMRHPPATIECMDSNNPNYYQQTLQPRISPRPASNAHSFSPLRPPSLHYSENNPSLRNPFPNQPHAIPSSGNLWLQRPPHPNSLSSAHPSFWPSHQPTNSPQINPHDYPPSNPY